MGSNFSNSLYGCYIISSDHIIITNCEVTNTGQEGIHANEDSDYIDIIGNHIHHTGRRVDHEGWGEGIYIGGGSDPQLVNSYIYIEGNEIYECGLGEGINIKSSDTEKVTVKNNHVHDIHPGKSTSPNAQWNGGAIGVSHHFTNTDRLIWIEDNLIENIYGGQTSNTGVMTMQSDTRVVGNTIRNCDDNGILFNDYISDHPCWNFGNILSNNGTPVSISTNAVVYTTNPGLSPYSPQTWYSDDSNQEPLPPVNGDNIALNKPVTVSAQQVGNEGSKAVDGSRADLDRWSAEFFPQTIEINLQGLYSLNRIDVFPLSNRAYQYSVEVKSNGGSYQQIINRTNSTTRGAAISNTLSNVEADVVKFTFTGAAVYDGDWLSIREIEIFGSVVSDPDPEPDPDPDTMMLLETNGDVFINKLTSGIIMISPNGSCHKVKINNEGNFVSEVVDCPN